MHLFAPLGEFQRNGGCKGRLAYAAFAHCEDDTLARCVQVVHKVVDALCVGNTAIGCIFGLLVAQHTADIGDTRHIVGAQRHIVGRVADQRIRHCHECSLLTVVQLLRYGILFIDLL